jgi:hypothetical protein
MTSLGKLVMARFFHRFKIFDRPLAAWFQGVGGS